MAQAVLSHSASRLVTVDELAQIPPGEPVGPRHKPVPHLELVTVLRDAFAERGYAVDREQYSVTRDGARLFGTLDLSPTTGRSRRAAAISSATSTRTSSMTWITTSSGRS